MNTYPLSENCRVAVANCVKLRHAGFEAHITLSSLVTTADLPAIERVCGSVSWLARPKTPGQAAYEEDCLQLPLYHDGSPRPAWDKLTDYTRQNWEDNPTARSYLAAGQMSAVCQSPTGQAALESLVD